MSRRPVWKPDAALAGRRHVTRWDMDLGRRRRRHWLHDHCTIGRTARQRRQRKHKSRVPYRWTTNRFHGSLPHSTASCLCFGEAPRERGQVASGRAGCQEAGAYVGARRRIWRGVFGGDPRRWVRPRGSSSGTAPRNGRLPGGFPGGRAGRFKPFVRHYLGLSWRMKAPVSASNMPMVTMMPGWYTSYTDTSTCPGSSFGRWISQAPAGTGWLRRPHLPGGG